MNSNGLLKKHWFLVTANAVIDLFLFFVAHLLGIAVRFGASEWEAVFSAHATGIIVGAMVFPAVAYIFGLYSPLQITHSFFGRAVSLASCILIAAFCSLPWNFITLTDFLGRGVSILSAVFAFALILVHHISLVHRLRTARERVLYIVGSRFDEAETRLFDSIGLSHLKLEGLVEYDTYKASSGLKVLGKARDLMTIVQRERIKRVLCTDKSLNDPVLCKQFCQLRYSGIMVVPLISLCEEIDRCVPLELVTANWLLNASAEPHMLYIEKLKRFFDIVVSLIGLVLSSPLFLVSAILIKLSSPGPIFYRQVRAARFGRAFEMIKLRTMREGAEKDGAVWCAGAADTRVTWIGRILRRYRIDEVPQLFNVLRGEMSFVGPRPERPEIIEKLSKEIPYYLERSLVQPGITGWAQVNFPYGSSVEDTRRKLEYDLYYLKHMSVPLDIFILLDTVRIVLTGGVGDEMKRTLPRQAAMQEWERFRTAQLLEVEAQTSGL